MVDSKVARAPDGREASLDDAMADPPHETLFPQKNNKPRTKALCSQVVVVESIQHLNRPSAESIKLPGSGPPAASRHQPNRR
jgi:hypothetical protein